MANSSVRRKRVRHFHEPGDLHELTFSCYRQMPLLSNDRWRRYLSQSIDAAIASQSFRLVAFAYMPEHLHLIVLPLEIDYVHVNPVRRGLCQKASQWRWSSARFYETDGKHQDRLLPRIDRLPAEFFDDYSP